MASTSEVGHAKNIANANQLIAYITEISDDYNPTNPKIQLTNLQALYNVAFQKQSNVNTALAPYSLAVDHREAIFKPLSKKITKLRKAYKATQNVTQQQLEDFMTIARRIKGSSQQTLPTTTPPEQQPNTISTSQMSYAQRTNNYAQLIALLQTTPNYNPNETPFQIATLQSEYEQMLSTTQAVAEVEAPLNTARTQRNNTLYLASDNLVDTFNTAKDYLFTILEANAPLYKAISRIKFKKVS